MRRYSDLHNAVDHGHTEMAELLLSYGAIVNAKCHTDGCAIRYPSRRGLRAVCWRVHERTGTYAVRVSEHARAHMRARVRVCLFVCPCARYACVVACVCMAACMLERAFFEASNCSVTGLLFVCLFARLGVCGACLLRACFCGCASC